MSSELKRRVESLEAVAKTTDPDRIEQLEDDVDKLRAIADRVPHLDELLDAVIDVPMLPEMVREQARKARASGQPDPPAST